jgi:hypothetical protein
MSKWHLYDNCSDNTQWWARYHHLDPHVANMINDDALAQHRLLRILGYLKVIFYVKDYRNCYEIEIKAK